MDSKTSEASRLSEQLLSTSHVALSVIATGKLRVITGKLRVITGKLTEKAK